MTNNHSEKLTVDEARGEARMLKANLQSPITRKHILDLVQDYSSESIILRSVFKKKFETGLDNASRSSEIMYFVVMNCIVKLVDDHPQEDVMEILRDQPNHHWWYEIAEALINADKIIRMHDYENISRHYSEMTEEEFELSLLSSEAKGTIYNLIGIAEGDLLFERLNAIQAELVNNLSLIANNPNLLAIFQGVQTLELAISILRARLKEEQKDMPAKVFAMLEQKVVADNELSLLQSIE